MAFLAFLVSCLVKKDRQQCHHQHQDRKPSMSMTFRSRTKTAKKRKMSDADKVDDEDVQRSIMIRKSLASRASSRTCVITTNKGKGTIAPSDDDAPDNGDSSGEDIDDERNSASLKSDWKAYEAGLQRNRSVLIRRHPGIDRSPGSASTAPLTPLLSTCTSSSSATTATTTTPTTPMTPMTTLSLPSASSSSSRTSLAPRQHTFPTVTRKPVPPPSSSSMLGGPTAPAVGRATTQA